MSKPFADHADKYNDLNLSIIPCGRESGKVALVKWKDYQYEAAGVSELMLWARLHSTANIGLITGRVNGLTVIDCDDPDRSVESLKREYGPTPLVVSTPRGGKHLYYQYNGERSQTGIAPKIDIRADGGYVVGPYSINPESGRTYTIIEGSLGDIRKLSRSIHCNLPKPGPNFIIHKDRKDDTARLKDGGVREGKRNSYLFKVCKDHAATVTSFDELLDFARSLNQTDMVVALPDTEVVATMKTIWGYKERGSLLRSGEQYIAVKSAHFKAIIKAPRALALYVLLLSHHSGKRDDFTIIHDCVAELIGCERKTLMKAIQVLLVNEIIERVHESTGRDDGHRYRFI